MPKKSDAKPITEQITGIQPAELRKGVYSNLINITRTDSEIVLDFSFLHPKDNPRATLVSRVVVPVAFADKIAKHLDAILKVEK